MDNTLAVAAVSAVVASGVTLVVNELKKVHLKKAEEAELRNAYQNGRTQGYYEGRESMLQEQLQGMPDPSNFLQEMHK